MIRVAVIGATGYAGAELVSLLDRHAFVEIAALFSGVGGRTATWATLHPSLHQGEGPDAFPFDLDLLIASDVEVVFLATPNEVSADLVPKILEHDIRVVDLSGSFRLPNAASYPQWYAFAHPAPALLAEAAYGLPEWFADAIAPAKLVANPGCYPTSILLALLPLRHLLSKDQTIVCDVKSGVSGAGRRQEVEYSFAELTNNFRAYGVGKHRHEPEIRHFLGINGAPPFVFVPHLLPVNRGILSTMHVRFATPQTDAELESIFASVYGTPSGACPKEADADTGAPTAKAPFVTIHPPGVLPDLRSVVGTPRCEIGLALLDDGQGAVIVSVLDNLLKGAASQAVQNFNLMFALGNREGLA
ncbi:MAG TPA: N-acetyl-gamma-glutamyl-phosphate reductase [Thermoanaerobaculia bacterium]|nr:N-acetyl-gamma-glutamyl-phosphate reductase [Thermoanaerobaculia bacterium]